MKRTLFTLLVILAAACGRSPRVHQIRNLGSTPYQEDTIRLTYGRDPERALVLLDSAVLLSTYDIMERQMGADTLNSEYAVILRDRGVAAKALGRPDQTCDYMHRYALLTRELSDRLQAGEAQDYAARYRAKEQELEIERAQSDSRTRWAGN